MAIDITLLRAMKSKEYFDKYYRLLNDRALDPQTMALIRKYKAFYEATGVDEIDVSGSFITWFNLHTKLNDDQRATYKVILEQAAKPADPVILSVLETSLLEADLAVKVQEAVMEYQQGKEVNLPAVVEAAVTEFTNSRKRYDDIPFVPVGGNIMDDDMNDTGFQWRWNCLARNMRKLRPGDFGILAGRPDKGKTTAAADLVAGWVNQIKDVYPDDWQERHILWLNNEGLGENIQKRILQSVLGCSTSKLIEMQKAGTLWPAYKEACGGRMDAIRVLDIHTYKHWQVEELLKRVKPAVVVFDMIDNVKFDGVSTNGGTRTDQLLEEMYKWGREQAVIHRCPMLALSQLSAEAEGVPYPPQDKLKDSRTGKQGACEFMIFIGTSNDPLLANVRFIGTPKNKLKREGKGGNVRAEMVIDHDSARYIDTSGVFNDD